MNKKSLLFFCYSEEVYEKKNKKIFLCRAHFVGQSELLLSQQRTSLNWTLSLRFDVHILFFWCFFSCLLFCLSATLFSTWLDLTCIEQEYYCEQKKKTWSAWIDHNNDNNHDLTEKEEEEKRVRECLKRYTGVSRKRQVCCWMEIYRNKQTCIYFFKYLRTHWKRGL